MDWDWLVWAFVGALGVLVWLITALILFSIVFSLERFSRKKTAMRLWCLVESRLKDCSAPGMPWTDLPLEKREQLASYFRWLWWTPRIVDELVQEFGSGAHDDPSWTESREELCEMLKREFKERTREQALAMANVMFGLPDEKLRRPAVFLSVGLGDTDEVRYLEKTLASAKFPEVKESLGLLKTRLKRRNLLAEFRFGKLIRRLAEEESVSSQLV